jgi:hypothetical protein
MQQAISAMQQEVHSINLHVEQSQLDIQECLKLILLVVMMRRMRLWLRMFDFLWCLVFIYFETFYLSICWIIC